MFFKKLYCSSNESLLTVEIQINTATVTPPAMHILLFNFLVHHFGNLISLVRINIKTAIYTMKITKYVLLRSNKNLISDSPIATIKYFFFRSLIYAAIETGTTVYKSGYPIYC